MYYVYVLKSLKNAKKYIGYTSKNPQIRMEEHNNGSNQYTKRNRPFELIYFEDYSDQASARKRELFLKSGHGRSFLKRALNGRI